MSERKPMIIIQNYPIDRHKAAVGECLLMAPMCRSKLCEVAVSSPWSALILEALSRPRSSHSYSD